MTANDPTSPNHYRTAGGIECVEAIRASLGDDRFCDYCQGNVMKYIWRWRHKHQNGVEDLKKASVYLNWLIEAAESHR